MGLVSDATAFGLFAMALLVPLTAASVWFFTRERDRPLRFRRLALWMSVSFLLLSSLLLSGWLWPDAYDRLPSEQRRAIGPALNASPECGGLPFARVVDVSITRLPGRQVVLAYTCGITPFGFPRLRNEATCGQGDKWTVPGLLDVHSVGDCSPVESG